MKNILHPLFSVLFLFVGSITFAQTGADPCNAIPLTVSETCTFLTFDNTGIADSGEPDPACGSYNTGSTADMWFKITVPVSGQVTITNAESTPVDLTDMVIVVYSGTACNSLTEVDCEDTGTMDALTLIGRTPGETLWIRNFDYQGNDEGTYDICVTTEYALDNNLDGQIITSCFGTLYDDGGTASSWGSNQDNYVVITAPNAQSITLDLNVDWDDAQDFIYIYDGNSTAVGDLLQTFGSGMGDPYTGLYTVSNNTLTIRFTSDVNGNNGNFDIDWQGDIISSVYVSQELACNGLSDGELTAIASGSSPYTYLWNPGGQTTQIISGLSAGSYNVTITDNNGCISKLSKTLTEPDALTMTETITDVLCNGDCDGTAFVNVAGGTGGYNYLWNTTKTTVSTFSNTTSSGPFSSTDFNYYINVAFPDLLDDIHYTLDSVCFNITRDNTNYIDAYLVAPDNTTVLLVEDEGGTGDNYTNTCFSMSAATSIVGQSAPFTGTFIPEGDLGDFNDHYMDPAGTWNLHVYNNYTNNTEILDCDLHFSSRSYQTHTDLCAGNYNVTVTDANGCTITGGPYTVNEPAVLAVDPGTDQDICFGESAILTAIGSQGTPNYSYLWNTTQPTQTITVAPGVGTMTYTVTVTDDNGCTASNTVDVTVNALPNATATNNGPVCVGEALSLTGGDNGMTNYAWSGPSGYTNATQSPTVSASATIGMAGTYTITVTDGNFCTSTATTDVTVNELPAVFAGSDQSIPNGTSTTIDASVTGGSGGPYTYSWTPAGDLVSATVEDPTTQNLTATTIFTLQATDNATSCQNSDNMTVTVTGGTLSASPSAASSSICFGNNTQVFANPSGGSGSYTYNWGSTPAGFSSTDANPTVNPTVTTTYTVTVDDGFSTTVQSVPVTVNSLPAASAGSDDDLCPGQTTVSLNASGGTSYAWSPSAGLSATNIFNPVANPAITTTYYVTVTDGNGCTDTDDVIVIVNSLPAANAGTDQEICNGDNTTINASGSSGTPVLSYTWDNLLGAGVSHSINPGVSTTYIVTVTDGNGCTDTDNVIITVNTLPNADAGTDASVCLGSSTTISAIASTGIPALSFAWDNGLGAGISYTVNPVINTTYTVTVTDGNGCTDTDDVIISINSLPAANAGSDDDLCPGQTTVSLNASGGTSYAWSPSTGLSATNIFNPVANPAITTTYYVTVTDGNGCTDTDDVMVTVNALPVAYAGADQEICDGDNTMISASGSSGSPVLTYSWDNGLGAGISHTINPVVNTTYTVEVTDGNGCTDTDDVLISVNLLPTPTFSMPTTFTVSDPAYTITTFSPPGGTFSGQGITSANNTFHPSTLSPNSYWIYYTYTDGNGCTNTDSLQVDVINSGGSIVGMPGDLCSYDSPVTLTAVLTTFSPVGFLTGQPGLTIVDPVTATFDPSGLPAGPYTIVYQHSGGFIDVTTEVHDISGQASLSGLLAGYCEDASAVTLIGTPSGGEFIGTGITNPVTGIFDPGTAGVGNTYVQYIITESVCTDTTIEYTDIYALPTVAFTPTYNVYNVVEAPTTLTGIPIPTAPDTGYFTGNIGLTNTFNGIADFDPSVAGVGSHDIIYTVLDGNGCSDAVVLPITVNAANATINGIEMYNSQNIYCYDNGGDTLVGKPIISIIYDPDSSYFTLNGVRYGSGIDSLGIDSIVLYPDIIGPGTHDLTYYYYDLAGSGAYFWVTESILIDSIGAISILTSDLEYCVSETQSEINGSIPLNCNGYWSYSGAISGGLVPSTSTSAWFFPSTATVGNYEIYYQCVNPATGCMNYDTAQAFVYDLPTINSTSVQSTYNYNISYPPLVGDPAPGTFVGPGVISNIFYPTVAGEGGPYNITYTYTDTNGCSNAITQQTYVVVAQASIDTIPSNNYYCKDGSYTVYPLVGVPDNIAAYQAGTGYFTINGIVDGEGIEPTGQDSINFYPDSLIAGSYSLSYYYTDTSGTEFNVTYVVHIDSIGFAGFSGLAAEYCVDDNLSTLISDITTLVGTHNFTGPGVSYNGSQYEFDPATAGATTVPYTIDYTFTHTASGCTSSSSSNTIVHALPVLEIITDTSFCANDPISMVYGSPAGPTGSLMGLGLISSGDSVPFNPAIVSGPVTISYQYIDGTTTCRNIVDTVINVKDVPQLNIISIPSAICLNAPIDTIVGTVGGSPSGSGIFGGIGINDNLDGTAEFDPSVAGVNTHQVYYTYLAPNGCFDTTFYSIRVDDIPDPSINVSATSVCENDAPLDLAGYPTGASGVYDINGIVTSSGEFDPGDYLPGSYPVSYTFTNNYGCSDTEYDTMHVHQVPYNLTFTPNMGCLNDSVDFIGVADCMDAIDDIYWSWELGVNSHEDTMDIFNPSIVFAEEGTYDVTLEVTSEYGCVETFSTGQIEVFDKPDVDFDWVKECYGDTIEFTNFPNGLYADSLVTWHFGDGDSITGNNATHVYQQPGIYQVELYIDNDAACTGERTRTTVIREKVNTFPYFEDFEGTTSSWYKETRDTVCSWVLETPDSLNAYSGINAWITKHDTLGYPENSSVISPCFDITGLYKPMVAMKIWSRLREDNDGAVLQYSVDYGEWENIGGIKTGINWYDSYSIDGMPGNQSIGWSSDTLVTWTDVKHALDNITGTSTCVRFRIAYGSDDHATGNDFAFDNIWIGERQKMVLFEHFTNASENECAVIDPQIHTEFQNNSNMYDVIDIRFHTSFPGQDQMNADNPADQNSRISFYSVPSMLPYSVIDGDQYAGPTQSWINYWNTLVSTRSLQQPKFHIDLTTDKTSSSVDIDADIIAQTDLAGRNVSFNVAVIEKEITSLVGANGMTTFDNVVKKLLPDAAGTVYAQDWTFNQTESVSLSWDYINVYDPSEVYVVAFIQDEDSKEIYQVTTDDPAIMVTEVEETILTELKENNILLFPNPTSGMVSVLFTNEDYQDCSLEIYNNIGKLIDKIDLIESEQVYHKDMSSYSEGMYLFRFVKGQQVIETKKLIVGY